MDMRTPTQITLASELAIQCLSHTKIAAHLGHHRKTIRLWLKGIATDGLAGFLARHAQAKKGPRRARQVLVPIKRLIWELRVREHDCCSQKIAYFLDREHHIRLSVPKIYEVLAEKYVEVGVGSCIMHGLGKQVRSGHSRLLHRSWPLVTLLVVMPHAEILRGTSGNQQERIGRSSACTIQSRLCDVTLASPQAHAQ